VQVYNNIDGIRRKFKSVEKLYVLNILLYDITNITGRPEMTPTGIKTTVPINVPAAEAYKLNRVNSKSTCTKVIGSPVLFIKDSFLGAWIYESPNKKCTKNLMHWYKGMNTIEPAV
jgi:hypothetical protein